MNKIQTYEGMLALEKQLETDLLTKKELILIDIAQLHEAWRPIGKMMSVLGKFNSRIKTHPLLSLGLGLAAEVLEKNMVVAGGGWISKLVLPWITRRFSSTGSSVIGNWIGKWKRQAGQLISH